MNTIRPYIVWIAILGLCVLAGSATAQGRGRGGPRISPEDSEKAWHVQASTIAKTLELAEADAEKLVEAYQTARRDQGAAMREAMGGGREGGGGDPMARFQAMRELNEKHVANLKTSLTDAIGEEAGGKAAGLLAAFDRQADGMTVALSAMELEEAKLGEAMTLVGDYASGLAKAAEEAFASMSMDAMRTARGELKTTLDDGMKKILSAEQLAEWTEKTTFRGRGGGRGPGGPGGGPGRGGAEEN